MKTESIMAAASEFASAEKRRKSAVQKLKKELGLRPDSFITSMERTPWVDVHYYYSDWPTSRKEDKRCVCNDVLFRHGREDHGQLVNIWMNREKYTVILIEDPSSGLAVACMMSEERGSISKAIIFSLKNKVSIVEMKRRVPDIAHCEYRKGWV